MLKLNCFILTVAISFFSLFLFKTEGAVALNKVSHRHEIKIDGLYNAFAISADNSFHELLSFDKQKLKNTNFIYAFTCLKNVCLYEGFNYFKLSHLLDLNLTTRIIIYPFHCFL